MHSPAPKGEPRPGALPALLLRRRTELPDAARTRSPIFIAVFVVVIFTSGGGKVKVPCILFVFSPLFPSHFSAFHVGVEVGVRCGEDETPRVSEKLKDGFFFLRGEREVET